MRVEGFDGNQAEVSGALEPGDIIVAAGAEWLSDGQQVKPMQSPTLDNASGEP